MGKLLKNSNEVEGVLRATTPRSVALTKVQCEPLRGRSGKTTERFLLVDELLHHPELAHRVIAHW